MARPRIPDTCRSTSAKRRFANCASLTLLAQGLWQQAAAVYVHVRVRHRFLSTHKKAPPVRVRLFVLHEVLGDDLLSHGETPHYHRR
jgi:hypothetical protein